MNKQTDETLYQKVSQNITFSVDEELLCLFLRGDNCPAERLLHMVALQMHLQFE